MCLKIIKDSSISGNKKANFKTKESELETHWPQLWSLAAFVTETSLQKWVCFLYSSTVRCFDRMYVPEQQLET